MAQSANLMNYNLTKDSLVLTPFGSWIAFWNYNMSKQTFKCIEVLLTPTRNHKILPDHFQLFFHAPEWINIKTS